MVARKIRKPTYRKSDDENDDQDRKDLAALWEDLNELPILNESLDVECIRCDVAAIGAGADDTRYLFVANYRAKLLRATFLPSRALAANAASYRKFDLQRWKNVGGAAALRGVCASRNTSQAGLTASIPYNLTLDTAEPNLIVDEEDVLILSITHVGAGPALDPGGFATFWRRLE